MTVDQPPQGIVVTEVGDRVAIEVGGARWEGTPAEAEGVLTRLHYVIGRARPGTNIGSMFLNGTLWGEKLIEPDPREAVRTMRLIVDRLSDHLDRLAAELERAEGPPG